MSQFFVGSGGGGGGSAIETITGNDGIPESPTANNFNLLTANATVKFAGSTATETLDFGLSNLQLGVAGTHITSGSGNTSFGTQALNFLTSGFQNVAVGNSSLHALTSGTGNTSIGTSAATNLTSGNSNTVVGESAGADMTTCNGNTAIGTSSLSAFTTGTSNNGFNVAVGDACLSTLTTGIYNTAIGTTAGSAYTGSESDNICIASTGVVGESHVLRIGNQGSGQQQVNECFIAGIVGVTTSNTEMVTINSSTGQLGAATIPASGVTFGPIVQTGASAAAPESAVTIPYVAFQTGNATSTTNVPSNGFVFCPIYVDETRTFTKIGCIVTNTPGAGALVQMALYDQTGSGGYPGAIIASAIGVSVASGGQSEGTISWNSTPGWYWIAIQSAGVGTVTIITMGNGDGIPVLTNKAFIDLGTPADTTVALIYNYKVTNTYGSFPSNPTISQNSPFNGVPMIYLR